MPTSNTKTGMKVSWNLAENKIYLDDETENDGRIVIIEFLNGIEELPKESKMKIVEAMIITLRTNL